MTVAKEQSGIESKENR